MKSNTKAGADSFLSQRGSEGSVALTAMASIVALSVATIYISSNSQRTKNSVDMAAKQNTSVEADSAALSDMAILRSALTPARLASGNYAPWQLSIKYVGYGA
ncbi:MAG: hypothetical protein H7249_06090 [Chitinophagaceae bacterium]|nr:hypothetical protein [Oligoflexus sp.]